MTGILAALLGSGGGGAIYRLTVGYYGYADKYGSQNQYGYGGSTSGGAINPTTFNGRTILGLYQNDDTSVGTNQVILQVSGSGSSPLPSKVVAKGVTYTLGSQSYIYTANSGGNNVTLANGTVNWTNHGLSVGDAIAFYATSYPAGISGYPTPYYVISVTTANQVLISATPGGAQKTWTGVFTVAGYKGMGYQYSANVTPGALAFGPGPLYGRVSSTTPAVFDFGGGYHLMSNGDVVRLSGTLPTSGFSVGVDYYVVNATATNFNLAATPGGTAINAGSTTGSGGSPGVYPTVVTSVPTVTIS